MAYRNNYEREDDPFLNPETVNDDVLKKMPKTRFFLGSYDPLRDGAVRLAYKMVKAGNVDIKVYEFKEYVHGFFGMGSEEFRKLPTMFLLREVDEFVKERERVSKG
jgi:acetyl esterase/lipase